MGVVTDVIPPFTEVQNEVKGVYEITPSMTAEQMQAMFFDADALREPPYKVWQLNSKGHRYYYRYREDGEPEFYPSVTTILSQTLPKNEFLIKWMCDLGYDEAQRYTAERASYGTFMHAQFERLLIERAIDLDKVKDDLKDYIEVNRLPADFINYADDLKKDILAFAQFVIDYKIKPLAVEITLVSKQGYAGTVDCPCRMTDPKTGEEFRAIVDFKSGKKGFYESCELQLGMYRGMWNESFPDAPIERIFNFAPKDWRKKPTYNLKEQTDSPNLAKLPHLLAIASVEDDKLKSSFLSVGGMVMLDREPNLEDNILTLSLAELVKGKTGAQNGENPKNE